MKSVRLDPNLEATLASAARALAMSQSEFIRDALTRRCQEVLGNSLAKRLAPVIGVVKSSGGRARHSGAAFRKILAERKGNDPNRRRPSGRHPGSRRRAS